MRDLGTNRIYLHRPSAAGVLLYRLSGGESGDVGGDQLRSNGVELDLERFRDAICRAMGRHEQLCSRIVQTSDGEAGYEPIAEPVCRVSIETYEPADPDDEETESLMDIAMEWAKEEVKKTFDLASGELMRHVLISDTVETIWGIAYHYLAGDAMSFQYLAGDVFALLEAPETELAPIAWVKQPMEMPEQAALALPARQKLQNMNKRWAKSRTVFTNEDFARMHRNFQEAYPLHLMYEELDEGVVSGLRAVSRARNVRFTALVAAAVALASQEKDTISVIVDVRPMDYRGFGVYSGGLGLQIPKKLTADFWDYATAFSNKIDSEIHNNVKLFHTELIAGDFDGTLLDAGYYARYDAFGDKTAEEMAVIYGIASPGTGTQINNMREVPLASNYSFGRLENVYFFPAMTPSYARAVGTATVGGRMAMTWSFYRDEPHELDLMRRTLEILREISK